MRCTIVTACSSMLAAERVGGVMGCCGLQGNVTVPQGATPGSVVTVEMPLVTQPEAPRGTWP